MVFRGIKGYLKAELVDEKTRQTIHWVRLGLGTKCGGCQADSLCQKCEHAQTIFIYETTVGLDMIKTKPTVIMTHDT